jgi:hypothetical protein
MVYERRPLRSCRFGIEVDLVCAGDIDPTTLAGNLVRLSTAGLYGMVSDIRRVVIDGKDFPTLSTSTGNLRPPPDARFEVALREAEQLVSLLRSALGRERVVEAVA